MNTNLTERDGIKRQGSLTQKLRWLTPSLVALAVMVALAVTAPAAKADSLDFVLTGTGSSSNFTIDFTLPSSPTPTMTGSDYFLIDSGAYVVDFFTTGSAINSGGLFVGNGTSTFVVASGAQLFGGTVGSPDFLINGLSAGQTVNYTLADGADYGQVYGNYGDSLLGGYSSFNLSITDTSTPAAAAPEPSSLLLLGAGLIGLSALIAFQQKKRGTLVAAPSDAAVS